MTEHCRTKPTLSQISPEQMVSWQPSPPTSEEDAEAIRSVLDLRRYWEAAEKTVSRQATTVTYIPISEQFDPTHHLDEISFIRRFDCYPTSLRVRMPSTVHEWVCQGLVREFFMRQIQDDSACFREIASAGSANIVLGRVKQSRSPDIQFRHAVSGKPRVIIEIAYTQQETELKGVAADYILGTRGKIKRVFGIKLGLPGRASTVSAWRAQLTPLDNDPDYDQGLQMQNVYCEEFRTADGLLVNPDRSIDISLRDFYEDIGAEVPDAAISIPFRTLFAILQQGEHVQNKENDTTEGSASEGECPSKRTKIFESTPSPVEELHDANLENETAGLEMDPD